ncbi:MAG: 50S ribosomal protein L31 [Vampirovibrionales bacterium]|nr:50S ribosomal protein L31 [Vampirovibrionales bacterium]
MKEKTHPQYNVVEAVCVCGHRLLTGTTLQAISVEICENCHPFYTGQQKIVDTEGRVERFNKRYADVAPATRLDAKKKAKEKAEAMERQQKRRAQAMAASQPKPRAAANPGAKPAAAEAPAPEPQAAPAPEAAAPEAPAAE